jgi:hypothetical protein
MLRDSRIEPPPHRWQRDPLLLDGSSMEMDARGLLSANARSNLVSINKPAHVDA